MNMYEYDDVPFQLYAHLSVSDEHKSRVLEDVGSVAKSFTYIAGIHVVLHSPALLALINLGKREPTSTAQSATPGKTDSLDTPSSTTAASPIGTAIESSSLIESAITKSTDLVRSAINKTSILIKSSTSAVSSIQTTGTEIVRRSSGARHSSSVGKTTKNTPFSGDTDGSSTTPSTEHGDHRSLPSSYNNPLCCVGEFPQTEPDLPLYGQMASGLRSNIGSFTG